MIKLKLPYAYLVMALICIIGISHSEGIHAANKKTDLVSFVDISDNIPSKEIQNIYQDREGYMWFATYNG